jgi:hypothetical protein
MGAAHKPLDLRNMAPGDERWALIHRIASSRHLKSSSRLREFLLYTADCAIRGAPEDATEQQIGIRVFGRPPGYNSSEDSIVRTHARLLRQKLAAYFSEEGSNEELTLEIPKGHYLLIFVPRRPEPDLEAAQTPAAETEMASTPAVAAPLAVKKRVTSEFRLWVIALLLIPGVTAITVLLWQTGVKPALAAAPVERFWQPFLRDEPPLVIYSNTMFVGDSTNGLRYASPPGQPSPQAVDNYVDTYTGIGELASVYTLARLFDSYHTNFVLKRSMLTTWDEAKTRNLVFIGSVAENMPLRDLQTTTEFTMVAGPGYAGLVNRHPKPGEPTVYSRPERPLTTDYAILALLPGVQSGKKMLIFSGLTTFGTQAAVDYVCHPDTAAELLRQVTGPKGEILPFEAVLQTDIGGGVPLRTRLVTIRVHSHQ